MGEPDVHTLAYSKHSSEYVPSLQLALLTVGRLDFLLVGTHKGALLVYSWPLRSDFKPLKQLPLHTDAVTALRVCQKTGVIVSGSLDGSLFVSSLALTLLPALSPATPLPKTSHSGSTTPRGGRGASADGFPAHLMISGGAAHRPLYRVLPSQHTLNQIHASLAAEIEIEAKQNRRRVARNREQLLDSDLEMNDYGYMLVKRSLWKEKEEQIKKIHYQAKSFQMEWEYKMRRDQEGLNAALNTQRDQFETEMKHTLQKQRQLIQKDKMREQELEKTLKHIENEHLKAAESLERLYERKLALEAKRHQQLVQKADEREAELELEIAKMKKQHAQEIITLNERLEQVKAQGEQKAAGLKEKLGKDFETFLKIAEEQDEEHAAELQRETNAANISIEQLKTQIQDTAQGNTILRGQLTFQKNKIVRSYHLCFCFAVRPTH